MLPFYWVFILVGGIILLTMGVWWIMLQRRFGIFLERHPHAVLWLKPIKGKEGKITDFDLISFNRAAHDFIADLDHKKKFSQLVQNDHNNDMEAICREVWQHGESVKADIFLQNEWFSGYGDHWFHCYFFRVNGLLVVIFSDIHRYKLQEHELKAANQQLHAANQQLQATEQQLKASNQQLQASNQQLINAEKEIAKRNRTLESYLEVAGVVFLVLHRDGSIGLINRYGCDLLGYDHDEIIGKDWFELAIGKERQNQIQHVFNEIVTGNIEPFEFHEDTIYNAAGEIRFILWHNAVIRDDYGAIIGTLSSGTDITDLKVTQQRLDEQQQRLSTLMENLPGMAYRCLDDENWTMMFVSEGCQELLNYRPEDLLHNKAVTYESLIVPDDRTMVRGKIKQGLKRGTKYQLEYRIITANGQQKQVWEQGQQVNYGGVNYLEGFITDVTARHEIEETIRKINETLEKRVAERTEQLEATNQELESFAYSVSHDLRSPLRGINGFSKMLMEEHYQRLDAHGQAYLQRLCAASEKMGKLIDDLLNLSRISRRELLSRQTDLSALCHDIVHELQQQNPQQDVQVTIEEGMTIWADTDLMRIVMYNLLDNAWKFSSTKRLSEVVIGRTTHNNHVAYFVRDNGAGFDMAYADKLFGAFQRLHKADQFPGTGIGLTSVQRIIRRHGGHIWAEAEPEKGATFYFTLTNNIDGRK